MDILGQHGALEYDDRRQTWRTGGWQGPATAMANPALVTRSASSATTDIRPSTMGSSSVASAG